MNLYNTWTPDPALLSQWQRWLGDKPFFITEWYAKGADAALALAKNVKNPETPINKGGAGFLVPTQQDRADFYENFTLGLLRHPGCIGWHYFRWQDDVFNHASNKGFLTVEYEPYEDLCASIKRINTQRYRLVDFFDAP